MYENIFLDDARLEILIEFVQNPLNEQLARAGALQFVNNGEVRQAAMATYQFLLQESLSKGQKNKTASLYDMLSYLMVEGERLGFN